MCQAFFFPPLPNFREEGPLDRRLAKRQLLLLFGHGHGNQCDNSDFDFRNAEDKELPVIKISSDEGREDCQQLKPKGTQASLGTTVIAVTILLILSILFSRVTVNVLVFVLRVVFFM